MYEHILQNNVKDSFIFIIFINLLLQILAVAHGILNLHIFLHLYKRVIIIRIIYIVLLYYYGINFLKSSLFPDNIKLCAYL